MVILCCLMYIMVKIGVSHTNSSFLVVYGRKVNLLPATSLLETEVSPMWYLSYNQRCLVALLFYDLKSYLFLTKNGQSWSMNNPCLCDPFFFSIATGLGKTNLFFFKGPYSKYKCHLGFFGLYGLGPSYPALPLYHQSHHKQCINERMWLCSNKTLCGDTEIWFHIVFMS